MEDAAGEELPACFQVDGQFLHILVNDQDAVYPITVDPLVTGTAWTMESDQAGSLFGTSVAVAGDVNADGYTDLIVGAPDFDDDQVDEGRAFLFLGSPAGLELLPSWTADGDQSSAGFVPTVATALKSWERTAHPWAK